VRNDSSRAELRYADRSRRCARAASAARRTLCKPLRYAIANNQVDSRDDASNDRALHHTTSIVSLSASSTSADCRGTRSRK